jgi:hypothetical protein
MDISRERARKLVQGARIETFDNLSLIPEKQKRNGYTETGLTEADFHTFRGFCQETFDFPLMLIGGALGTIDYYLVRRRPS